MNHKISFLMTTARDWNIYGKNVVDSIYRFISSDIVDFDILVCCPFPVIDNRIKWVKDTIFRGGNTGFHLAYKESSGDLLTIISDDHTFITNPFNIINDFCFNNTSEIGTLQSGGPCFTGYKHPWFPEYNKIDVERFLMLRWPVIPKYVIETYLDGYIFHPDFHSQWMDNWLGWFAGKRGYRTFECNAKLHRWGVNEWADTPTPDNPIYKDADVMVALLKSYNDTTKYTHIL